MVAIQHDPSLLPPSLKVGHDGREPIEWIAVPDGTARPAKIKEFKTVGSFSYVDGKEPCVLVPSAPPEVRLRLPVKVRPDSGDTLLDAHALRLPNSSTTSPLSSSIQVAHLLTPTLDFSSLSFITSEGALLDLFGMIRGEQKAFRIDGELAGDGTVLLSRCEKEVWDKSHAFKGYGESFKSRETVEVKGCEGTIGGHWRLSTFELGHHKILIRYQVDAQLPLPPPSKFNTPPRSTDASSSSPSDCSSPIDIFASLPFTTTPTPFLPSPSTTNTQTLTYLPTPSSVTTPPQSSLLSLLTTPVTQPFSPSSYWPHLYLTQTPLLYLGAHDKFGTFAPSHFQKLYLERGELKVYGEREGLKVLSKLGKVLERMRRTVKREGRKGEGVSFVFEGGGAGGAVVMKVWRVEEGRRRRVGEEMEREVFVRRG